MKIVIRGPGPGATEALAGFIRHRLLTALRGYRNDVVRAEVRVGRDAEAPRARRRERGSARMRAPRPLREPHPQARGRQGVRE